ncbi:hypothetical protein L916_13200 [Phytophthora nicotianae]|uniref:Uncharacterized protein n=5 Tax=Phytophthora nicotianae TaxID=4792 RepID=V9ERG5_PHYNI|nr:hypothetical protein F443_13645 [Phytophthora nicotianae P1569]ETL34599.1 hypothetical protein L916_13200 [Phytophthora nicotianae]ETO69770.1 hypothetical protein F444_13706 [Phytophthora nicotianae P1976]
MVHNTVDGHSDWPKQGRPTSSARGSRRRITVAADTETVISLPSSDRGRVRTVFSELPRDVVTPLRGLSSPKSGMSDEYNRTIVCGMAMHELITEKEETWAWWRKSAND